MFEHGFPPYWSTIKKLIWLVGTGIVGGVTEIWKTVTGTLIHITDALASPMQKCEVTLEPIQSGSGDPSPTNVRPITGWTGCEVWVKDEYDTTLPATASVTFPETVYGGKADVVSGNDYADWVAVVFDGVNKQLNVASTSYIGDTTTRGYFANGSYKSISGVSDILRFLRCDKAKPIASILEQGLQSCYVAQNSAEINLRILNSLTGITSADTAAQAKTKLNAYLAENPITFCYKLNEPIPFTTTPQEISTLAGENNVWSNSNGDTTIIYKAQA